MKIIHTADIHLDSLMATHLSEAQAQKRRLELRQNFANLISYAKRNSVQIVLISGDLFDTIGCSRNAKEFVLDQVRNSSEITFLYLKGNHDHNVYRNEKLPENLKLFLEEWTYFKFDDDICICGTTIKEANNGDIFSRLKLNPQDKNIVALHGQITNSNAENTSYGIPLDSLRDKNIDYLALGHLHNFEEGELDSRAIYTYSGALEGRGFDECGDKGFILLESTPKGFKHKFIPFCTRKLHEIRCEVQSQDTTSKILQNIIAKCESVDKRDLIKVILLGEHDLDIPIDTEYIAEELNGKFFFARVVNKLKPKLDLESLKTDVSIKGEFVRLVLSQELNEEDKQKIIEYGTKALDGEEL